MDKDFLRHVEFEALITKKQAMLVENDVRLQQGCTFAYGGQAFHELAEWVRRLLKEG